MEAIWLPADRLTDTVHMDIPVQYGKKELKANEQVTTKHESEPLNDES